MVTRRSSEDWYLQVLRPVKAELRLRFGGCLESLFFNFIHWLLGHVVDEPFSFLMITYITAFKSSQIDVYKVYLLIWYTGRWWLTTHSVHLIFPARAAWWHPPLRSLCPIWNRIFTPACQLSQTWACASLPGASCGSGVWQWKSPLLILSGFNLTNCKNPLTS